MWQQQLLTFLRNFNLSNLQAALGGTIFRFYAETRHQTILRRFLLQLLIWNELDLDGSGTRNVRIKITPTLPPTGLTVDIESMGVPLSDVSLTLFIGLNNDVWPAGGAPAQMDFAFVSYIGQAGEAMPGQLTIFFEQKTVGGDKFLLARLATPSAPNPLHMRAGTFTSPVTVQPAKQSLPFGGELDVKIRTGNLLTATNMVDADLVLRSSTPGQLHLQLPMEVEFTSNTGGASHIHVSYNAPASLDIGVEARTRGPGVGLSQASIKGMPKAVSLSYQEAPAVGTPNITYSAPNAVIPEIVVFSQSEDSSTTPPTFSYLDARVSDIPPAVKVFLGSGAIRLVTESAIGGTGVIGRIRVERSTTDGAPIPSIGEQAIYHDMVNMVTVANMRDIVAASFETQAAPPGFTTPTIGVLNYESTQRYSLGLLVKTGVDTEVRANLEFLPKSLTVRTDFINVVEWTATDAISTLSAELWNWTMHSSGARRRTITFVSADNLPARFRLNRYGTQQVQWGSPFDRLNRVQVRHFIDVPNWAEAGIQPPPVPVRPITIECVASGLPSQFTLSEIATIAPGPRVVDSRQTRRGTSYW